MSKNSRQIVVAREIISFACEKQKGLMNILKNAQQKGKAERINQIEIVNGIGCRLTSEIIKLISHQPEVGVIKWDRPLSPDEPPESVTSVSEITESLKKTLVTIEPEPGVAMIHAPEVWDMGFTGQDILVAIIDPEGFNYTHPDLSDHLWDGSGCYYYGVELTHHGWDFANGDNDPYRIGGHGTLVAGVIAGDGTGDGGSQQRKTGIAPDATLMFLWGGTEAELMSCFNFLAIAKDQNGANFKMPDIINMSRSVKFNEKPSYGEWRYLCESLLDLGIVHINSAGNEGTAPSGGCNGSSANGYPIPYNVAAPANCPPPWLHPNQPSPVTDPDLPDAIHISSAIAVGYVDASGETIGSSSSRGPNAWENIEEDYPCQTNAYFPTCPWDYLFLTVDEEDRNPLIKPDVVAPGGNDIYSTNYSSGSLFYTPFSLTSCAAPHVTGTVALLLQANPDLEPEDMCRILQLSTIQCDDDTEAGKDNNYGAGRVDVYQALIYSQAEKNKTPNISPTIYNNQRIIARGKNNSNVLYEVFYSGDGTDTEIFFRNSTNNGTNWGTPVRLSTGDLNNRLPCISVTDEGSEDGVHVVWQRKKDNGKYEIIYRGSDDSGTTWASQVILQNADDVAVSSFQSAGPMPVITWVTVGSTYRLLVVYAANDGFHWRYKNSSGSWIKPSSDILSNPTGCYQNNSWFPSLMGERDKAAFTCDYRSTTGVYSRVYTASTNTWSGPVSICNDVFTTINDRQCQVGITYGGTTLAAWAAQKTGDPYYRILYREGSLNNTWSSQYHEFSKIGSDKHSYYPTVISYSSGNYTRAIVVRTSLNCVFLYRYNPSSDYWSGYMMDSNTDYPNISHETGTSLPKMIWTDISSSPYEITVTSDHLSKAAQPQEFKYHRRITIGDIKNRKALSIQLGDIQVVTTKGDSIPLDLISVPKVEFNLTTKNYQSFLGTETIELPEDAEKLNFYSEVYTTVPYDTGKTKSETNFKSIAVEFSIENFSKGKLVSTLKNYSNETGWISQSGISELGIKSFAGMSVTFKTTLSGITLIEDESGYSLGHIWIENSQSLPKKETQISNHYQQYFNLLQNFPNPFNPETEIRYTVAQTAKINLRIFNLMGREIATIINNEQPAGYYTIKWNGRDDSGKLQPSGVYFFRLTDGIHIQQIKMILLK